MNHEVTLTYTQAMLLILIFFILIYWALSHRLQNKELKRNLEYCLSWIRKQHQVQGRRHAPVTVEDEPSHS
jgi:hypothetical protein